MRPVLPLAAAIGLAAACSDASPVAGCTESLSFVSVQVLDTIGAPAPAVTASHHVPRTGRTLTVPQDGSLAAQGRYVVLTDIQRGEILPAGDTVRMTGIQGTTGFVADFFLDVPEGCHVRKVAGPDTVRLQATSQRLRR
jgi:hypothetical protein